MIWQSRINNLFFIKLHNWSKKTKRKTAKNRDNDDSANWYFWLLFKFQFENSMFGSLSEVFFLAFSAFIIFRLWTEFLSVFLSDSSKEYSQSVGQNFLSQSILFLILWYINYVEMIQIKIVWCIHLFINI